MNANTLLTQILYRSDVLAYQWAILAAFGLAALVAAARNATACHLLFLGFAFFAVSHLLGVLWTLKQWAALAASLKDSPNWKIASDVVRTELAGVIEAPSMSLVMPVHLVFDAFVLTGLWWLSRKRGL